MTISQEGLDKGHHYESSRMSGNAWCYQHKYPTYPCDYDEDEDEDEDED